MKIYVNGTIMPNREVPIFIKGDKGDRGPVGPNGGFPESIQIVPQSFIIPSGWTAIGNLTIGSLPFVYIQRSASPQDLRQASLPNETILFAGNYTVQTPYGTIPNMSLGGILNDNWPGLILSDYVNSGTIENIWDMNGSLVNDVNWKRVFVTQNMDNLVGYGPLNSPEMINTLQYFYWAGLKAKANGGELILFAPWSPRSVDLDSNINSTFAYIRNWLAEHLDMPVFLVPSNELVRRMRNEYTDAMVFSDETHLAVDSPYSRATSYLIYSFLTQQRCPFVTVGDEDVDQMVWDLIEEYRWAGMGGATENASPSSTDYLINPLPLPDEPVINYVRSGSSGNSKVIYSGNELMDSFLSTGVDPYHFRNLRNSLLNPDSNGDENDVFVAKSIISNSPMAWRWTHPTTPFDAKENINSFDTLVITENGPPPRVRYEAHEAAMQNTLTNLMNFVENTQNLGSGGVGAETILFSTWPDLNGYVDDPAHDADWGEFAGFRGCLPEFGKSFKFMADYASWKMKRLYPQLGNSYRVWLFPGHYWMMRLFDDIENGLVPNVETISDLFENSTQLNTNGGYGLACAVYSMLYQTNLRVSSAAYAPEGMDENLVNYFHNLAWEVATSFETVGMNGIIGVGAEFDPQIDGDPLDPNYEPPSDENLPTDMLIKWDVSSYEGPELTGNLPIAINNILRFQGSGYLLDRPTGQYYMAIKLKKVLPSTTGGYIFAMVALTSGQNWWDDPVAISNINNYNSEFYQTYAPVGASGGEWYNATSLYKNFDEWNVLESWFMPTETGLTVGMQFIGDNPRVVNIPDHNIRTSENLLLFKKDNDTVQAELDVAGFIMMERMPTDEERTRIREWLNSKG